MFSLVLNVIKIASPLVVVIFPARDLFAHFLKHLFADYVYHFPGKQTNKQTNMKILDPN